MYIILQGPKTKEKPIGLIIIIIIQIGTLPVDRSISIGDRELSRELHAKFSVSDGVGVGVMSQLMTVVHKRCHNTWILLGLIIRR